MYFFDLPLFAGLKAFNKLKNNNEIKTTANVSGSIRGIFSYEL